MGRNNCTGVHGKCTMGAVAQVFEEFMRNSNYKRNESG